MGTYELQEAQLKKALAIYRDDLLRQIPDDGELQQKQSFSAYFEEKMRKLIQKASASPQQLHLQMARRIAAIFLIFTLTTAALMSVEAIRVPILRFFAEVHQTFTRIVFGAEEETFVFPEGIEQVFVPGFVPEGFALEFELLDTAFAIQNYRDGEAYFEWSQYSSNVALHVDTEGTTTEEIMQGGISYLYFENKGVHTLIWEQSGYIFTCDGTIGKDALLEIAKSLQEKN